MTKLRYHMAAALILAGASTPLTSCKSAETPAPAASAPAERLQRLKLRRAAIAFLSPPTTSSAPNG